jgi:ssDNA-binding Zn-finger/Zn-ribbon topoisomerase 1
MEVKMSMAHIKSDDYCPKCGFIDMHFEAGKIELGAIYYKAYCPKCEFVGEQEYELIFQRWIYDNKTD